MIEILVVVAIVVLLAIVALLSLSSMRDRLLLNDAESSLIFHLEESKARSVSGSGGEPHGIYFEADSYTQFTGDEYDENDSSNMVQQIDPALEFVTDILEDENGVVFSRITGTTGENVEIKIRLKNDPSSLRQVMVGAGGDITSGD